MRRRERYGISSMGFWENEVDMITAHHPLLTRLLHRVDRFLAVPRFLLTGDCGMACDWTWFRQLDGKPVNLWVPECGCPVHDGWFTRWI